MKEKLVLGRSLDEAAYNHNKEAIRNLQENPGKVGTIVSKREWRPYGDYVSPSIDDFPATIHYLAYRVLELVKKKKEKPDSVLIVDDYSKFKKTLTKKIKGQKGSEEVLSELTQDLVKEEPGILNTLGKEQSGNILLWNNEPDDPIKDEHSQYQADIVYLDIEKDPNVKRVAKIMAKKKKMRQLKNG
jgi:hypothetical protein